MIVKFYTTNCPKCNVLEKKLTEKNIPFEKSTNIEELTARGFMFAPVLEVDGEFLDFTKAVDWVNNQ